MSIRAPQGFKFEVTPKKRRASTIYVVLFDTRRPVPKHVGEVELKWVNDRVAFNENTGWRENTFYNAQSNDVRYKRFETHSHLREEYRGRGLGLLLYSKAIEVGLNRGLKISSSRAPSEYAERVWNSRRLRNNFVIRKGSNGRYHALRQRGT